MRRAAPAKLMTALTLIVAIGLGLWCAAPLAAAPTADGGEAGEHEDMTTAQPSDESTAGQASVSAARGWAGVKISRVPDAVAAHLKVPQTETGEPAAVLVLDVAEDGPAEKAGLRRHDVVTHIGDDAVAGYHPFVQRFLGYKPGDQLKLTVISAGKTRKAALTLTAPIAADQRVWKHADTIDQVPARRTIVGGWSVSRKDGGWQIKPMAESDPNTKRLIAALKARGVELDTTIFPHEKKMIAVRRLEGDRLEVTTLERGKSGRQVLSKQEFKDHAAWRTADKAAATTYLQALRRQAARAEAELIETRRPTPGTQQYILQRTQQETGEPVELVEPEPEAETSEKSSATYRFRKSDAGLTIEKTYRGDTIEFTVKNADQLKADHPGAYQAYQRLLRAE